MARGSIAKAEKAKKTRKATSSGSGAPAGGASGDWIPSCISAKRLEDLAAEGLIPQDGWCCLKAVEFFAASPVQRDF